MCDSSAAIGITGRRGVGKVRHLDVAWLWVQEKAERGLIAYGKVPREDNVADVFTKAAGPLAMGQVLKKLNPERRVGRPRLKWTEETLGDVWNKITWSNCYNNDNKCSI